MVLFRVSSEQNCELCGEVLVINCRLDVREGWGVCDECGLPYSFSPKSPSDGERLDSVEPAYDSECFDWEIIESYYEATGGMAVVVVYCDATEEQATAFFEWANNEFDMRWGVGLDGVF